MAFAGWFYMDGEPVFDGDEPVIATADPLNTEIIVFARFIESPAEEDTDPSVGTPEMASGDTADAADGEPDTPADAPEKASDDTEQDTDPSVGTPLGASADTADTADDTADPSVGTPEMASADDTDAADDEAAEQDAEQAAEEDAESDEPATDEPAEPVPFDQSVLSNGVLITVKADAGTFPAGATLSVMRVLLYEQNQAEAAVDEVRDKAQNVAARYTFDISILDEYGNELQPAEGHSVEVSFALAEAGDENQEANVYHIDDDMTAEKLDAVATDEAVTAVTDGFSLYTVEFTYNDLTYELSGNSAVRLSEILDAVGLKGAAESVEVSAPELFSAYIEGGEWIVKASLAFGTEEWMDVVIGGVRYRITVTDDQIVYLTLNPGTGGKLSVTVNGTPYDSDTCDSIPVQADLSSPAVSIYVTATPDDGYKLKSLYRQAEGSDSILLNDTYFFMPYFDTTLTAEFEPTKIMTVYLDKDDTKKSEKAMQVTNETIALNGNQAEWYYVKGNVTITDRINVQYDVNLILCDGAMLTVPEGIRVQKPSTGTPNSLTIYAQSTGAYMGKLVIGEKKR